MTVHIYTSGPDDRSAATKVAESKLFADMETSRDDH